MDTDSAFDSLELVELVMRLEELGVEVSDAPFDMLRPYLVAPYSLEWQVDSFPASVEVIAEHGCRVLAVHDSGNVLVGDVTGDGVGQGRRFRSMNLACREFVRLVENVK
jgi:hypothetical protein